MLYFDLRPVAEVRAIHRVIQADHAFRQVTRDGDADDIATAEHHLRAAVDVAVDNGVSWQAIGDVLGIRRRNAYRRHRRRSRLPRA
jgi:hypothetical protein